MVSSCQTSARPYHCWPFLRIKLLKEHHGLHVVDLPICRRRYAPDRCATRDASDAAHRAAPMGVPLALDLLQVYSESRVRPHTPYRADGQQCPIAVPPMPPVAPSPPKPPATPASEPASPDTRW